MGTSYNFLCRDCKVDIECGSGSYSSWSKALDGKDSPKAWAVKYCTDKHSGHDYVFYGGDASITVVDNELIQTFTDGLEDYPEKIATDYNQFQQIDDDELWGAWQAND